MVTKRDVFEYIKKSVYEGDMRSYAVDHVATLSPLDTIRVVIWEEQLIEALDEIIANYTYLFKRDIDDIEQYYTEFDLSRVHERAVVLAENREDPRIPGFFRAIAQQDKSACYRIAFNVYKERKNFG